MDTQCAANQLSIKSACVCAKCIAKHATLNTAIRKPFESAHRSSAIKALISSINSTDCSAFMPTNEHSEFATEWESVWKTIFETKRISFKQAVVSAVLSAFWIPFETTHGTALYTPQLTAVFTADSERHQQQLFASRTRNFCDQPRHYHGF